jgi:acyl-CoA synthetase (NDP forming)
MDRLFKPKSAAIVGASVRENTLGFAIIRNLVKHGFSGPIYPVNPKYDEIAGLKCYPSIADVPGDVDVAYIAVAAARGPDMLAEVANHGVRAAIVNASGYADGGAEGIALQARLSAVAEEHGIVVCGPNNMGLVNVHDKVALWPAQQAKMPRPGPVAAISQSGSVAMVMFLDVRELGISYAVTAGNEAVLTAADYLRYFVRDDRVTMVMAFLETIRDPRGFAEAADEARAAGKQVIVVKVGRSDAGTEAVAAHTGAIAGQDSAYDAFFRQHGIIRAADLDELLETAVLLSSYPKPPPTSSVVPVTLSGGEAALVADMGEELGVSMPPLSPATVARLRPHVPTFFNPRNPLDAYGLGWNEERFQNMLEALVADPDIGTIAIATDSPAAGGHDEVYSIAMGRMFKKLAPTTDKRFVFINNTASAGVHPEVKAIFDEAGVPHLLGMHEGIAALGHWIGQIDSTVGAEPVSTDIASTWRARTMNGAATSEVERFRLLADVGVAMIDCRYVSSADQAVAAAEELGYPVALKGSGAAHKTELGLVRLALDGPDAVRQAWQDLAGRLAAQEPGGGVDGLVIQPMAKPGVELIVGIRNDPVFGPIIAVGPGGIFVEILNEVSVRLAPVDRQTALKMLDETRLKRLLGKFRGRGPFDIEAAADAVAALSQFGAATAGLLAAVEVNPLIVHEEGCGVVGVDVLLEPITKS